MKKIILTFLCIALVFSCLCTATVYFGGFQTEAATSVSSLKQKQNKIQSQITALEKEISAAKSEQKDALKQKELLSSQISSYQEDISTTNALIAAYEKEISEKEQLLRTNEQDYDALYEELKTRIRVMYENGNVSYLEVLLSSKDISDLLTRADVINALVSSDKKKLSDLLETREEIKNAKAELEADEAEVQQQKDALVEKKATLQSKQNEVDELLSTLSEETEENKEALKKLEEEEAKLAKEIAQAAKDESTMQTYVGGTFAWPLPGYYHISSYFGMRTHPITGVYKLHTGIDISRAPVGTAILSANAGKVIRSTYHTAYGNYVMVDHGGGKVTLYAHMSKRSVSVGDVVEKGQKLGEVGSTGYSTGAHLHFEIIIDGQYVNPLNYFTLS